MSPDLTNGLFEFVGFIFTLLNIYRIYKDKGYSGIYIPSSIFFTLWGFWNLYYYPSLGQWFSFCGGALLVIGNMIHISLMIYYGRKGFENE